jgi:hypothetical protein
MTIKQSTAISFVANGSNTVPHETTKRSLHYRGERKMDCTDVTMTIGENSDAEDTDSSQLLLMRFHNETKVTSQVSMQLCNDMQKLIEMKHGGCVGSQTGGSSGKWHAPNQHLHDFISVPGNLPRKGQVRM